MLRKIVLETKNNYGVFITFNFIEAVDRSEFIKTPEEKLKLKKLKSRCKRGKSWSKGTSKRQVNRHKGRLIMYFKPGWRRPKDKRDEFKSVIVIKCLSEDINEYIAHYTNGQDRLITYKYVI
jgi:hypothetical protein